LPSPVFISLILPSCHAANHLHVEMAQAKRPAGGLAHHGEGFGQQVGQGGALGQAGAELGGLGLQRRVGQCFHGGFQRVDLGHAALVRLQRALVGGTEDGAGDGSEHETPFGSAMVPERSTGRRARHKPVR